MADKLNGEHSSRRFVFQNSFGEKPSTADLAEAEQFEREVEASAEKKEKPEDEPCKRDSYYEGEQLLQAQFNHKVLTREQENRITRDMNSAKSEYAGHMLSVGKAVSHLFYLVDSSESGKRFYLIHKLFGNTDLVTSNYEETKNKVLGAIKDICGLLDKEDIFSAQTQKAIWERREKVKEMILPWKPLLPALDILLDGDLYFPGVKTCADLLEGKLKLSGTNPKELRRRITQELGVTPGEIMVIAREGEKARDIAYAEREKLITQNQRLIMSIAKGYVWSHPLLGINDLVGVAQKGLMKAIEKFEPERGYKLSTYATWWIRQAITRETADKQSTVRRPVHIQELANKLVRIRNDYESENGQLAPENLIEFLAGETGVNPKKIRAALEARKGTLSFDFQRDDGEGVGDDLYQSFEDEKAGSPLEQASSNLLREKVEEVMSSLPERERIVLEYRFGFNKDNQIYTLEEVGQKFKVTRERIRQIEAKALKRLRHPSRAGVLKGDYDALT